MEDIDSLMDGLIDFDPYHSELRDNHSDYQKIYQKEIGEADGEFLESIRRQLDEGVYGKSEFVREMKEKFKIKSLRLSGRPRKEERKE